jgi:hypothetical protein
MTFRIVFLLLLSTLCGSVLSGQFHMRDSVRPGIKSITRNICGYGPKGDSTGMKFYSSATYNTQGRIIERAETQEIAFGDFPRESAGSWYYESRSLISAKPDTTRYRYNSAGKLIEKKYKGLARTTYAYDDKNRCIKEQFYYGTDARNWKKYEYSDEGRLFKSSEGMGAKVNVTTAYVYDEQGREVLKTSIRKQGESTDYDTTRTSYSSAYKAVSEKGSYKGYTEFFYTPYDSVKEIRQYFYYENGHRYSDTMIYERDSVTARIKRTQHLTMGRSYSVVLRYNEYGGLEGRTTYTDNVLTSSTTYNSVGQRVVYEQFHKSGVGRWSTEYYRYNDRGDMVEYRMLDANGNPLQHETYTYKYY